MAWQVYRHAWDYQNNLKNEPWLNRSEVDENFSENADTKKWAALHQLDQGKSKTRFEHIY